jgi:hypothetical protein
MNNFLMQIHDLMQKDQTTAHDFESVILEAVDIGSFQEKILEAMTIDNDAMIEDSMIFDEQASLIKEASLEFQRNIDDIWIILDVVRDIMGRSQGKAVSIEEWLRKLSSLSFSQAEATVEKMGETVATALPGLDNEASENFIKETFISLQRTCEVGLEVYENLSIEDTVLGDLATVDDTQDWSEVHNDEDDESAKGVGHSNE